MPTGMNFITIICVGSALGGVGFNFVVKNMSKAMTKGRTKKGSGADRSVNQKAKGACLNSKLSLRTKNKAIKKGNDARSGKQPPKGLTPSRL